MAQLGKLKSSCNSKVNDFILSHIPVGELEKVLTSKNPCTPCIPTSKMLDLGSVSSCTTKSHSLQHSSFVFCKIWRWADLQSLHELKSIDRCNFPLSKTQDEVS